VVREKRASDRGAAVVVLLDIAENTNTPDFVQGLLIAIASYCQALSNFRTGRKTSLAGNFHLCPGWNAALPEWCQFWEMQNGTSGLGLLLDKMRTETLIFTRRPIFSYLSNTLFMYPAIIISIHRPQIVPGL
jgi:hypothetical protein